MKKQKVLITGSGTGLGKEAALALAKRGHHILATTKHENEAIQLNKLAKKENIDLIAFKLDILNKKDRDKILNYNFNILVNNAAIGDSGSVSEINIEKIKKVFQTNVFASIELTQIVLNKFIKQKHGKIIFLSSLFGRIIFPFLSPYCASKFAIESFASSLRQEMKILDGTNIQVCIIEPGAYATGFNQKNIQKKYEWMKNNSYFKYKWQDIKLKEEKVFKFLEKKNFNSIVKQYIRAIEDKKLKHRYTAPKIQAFFIQLGRIFGM